MISLNLVATTEEEKTVKLHLEQMVSEVLANKINNGVGIEKDGKRLINKKTLPLFMEFAYEEAQKIANKQKGKNRTKCVGINGKQIMSWAIHYFEEDSIIGTLYNEDGTTYKPPAPVRTATPAVTYTPPKPAPKPQISMFDLMNETADEQTEIDELDEDENELDEDTDEPEEELTEDELGEQPEETQPEPPIAPVKAKTEAAKTHTCSKQYQLYMATQSVYPKRVVAILLGDFYEVFGDHAIFVGKELGLTITSRDCGLEKRVPMIGFPYHAADNYFKQILKRHDVVILEGNEVRLLDRNNTTVKTVETAPPVQLDPPEDYVPTVTQETAGIITDEELAGTDGLDEELALAKEEFKAFNSTALGVLIELFDNKIIAI